jgi:hypothetical protein
LLSIFVIPLIENLAGASLSGQLFHSRSQRISVGGSSPEQRPINDMDYDLDVPLPEPPDGATTPIFEVMQQPQHATAVSEVVSFTNPVNGPPPTTAHIHLPYTGADNASAHGHLDFPDGGVPASHFQVSLNRVKVIDTDGKWQMWADVSGQWEYLSGLPVAAADQGRRQPWRCLPTRRTSGSGPPIPACIRAGLSGQLRGRYLESSSA